MMYVGPNWIVPTPPAGDSSNRIASTEFVTGNTRRKISTSVTYYVRTDGSNGNNGESNTAAGAFLTIQKAVDVVASLDISTNDVTIQVANGTYTVGALVNSPFVGSGNVTLQGNATTPSSCLIAVTNAIGIQVQNNAILRIGGFKITATTSGGALVAYQGGQINIIAPMDYGACASYHIQSGRAGRFICTQNYTISGGSVFHWLVSGAAQLTVQLATVNLTGTPAFSGAFAYCDNVSVILCNANTFNGSATGPRYAVSYNAVIFTNSSGTTYLPGNSAGSGTNSGTSPYGLYQ